MGLQQVRLTHKSVIALGLSLIVAGSAAACGNSAPTADPTRVIHIENRTSTAVMVVISGHDLDPAKELDTAVRPCGGKVDLTAGVGKFPATDWQIMLGTDPTGSFDFSLENWTGDPIDMPGNYTIVPMWSRGDIATTDLPRWITVTPTDVAMTSTAPAPDAGSTCDPYVIPADNPTESPNATGAAASYLPAKLARISAGAAPPD